MIKFKLIPTILALGGTIAAVSLSPMADAAATPKNACAVNQVFYDGGRLAVRCVGASTLYYASNYGSCNVQSTDTLKAWQNLAQVSLISGHTIDMMYEPAAGSCAATIYSMSLL